MVDTVVLTERRDVSFAAFAFPLGADVSSSQPEKSANDSNQERTS